MEEVREPKGGQQKAMVKGAESEDVRLASGKKKKTSIRSGRYLEQNL